MPTLMKPAKGPGISLAYVTIGAIMTVLSGTSFFFMGGSEGYPILGYIRMVTLILGVALLVIGFLVGRIGQVSGESQIVSEPALPQTVASPLQENGTPVYTATNTTRGA